MRYTVAMPSLLSHAAAWLSPQSRLRRGFELLNTQPIGRRFDPSERQLGLMQRWYAAQPTQRVVVAVLELAAPIANDELERALRVLCARQPDALGVCVARSPARVRLRPLMAADVLPWQASDEELWPLSASLLHRPFAPGAPLFRVALAAQRRALVCAFDHLVADGVSAALFACELARLLAGETLEALPEHTALPLDARLDLRPSLPGLLRALRKDRVGDLWLVPTRANTTKPFRTRVIAQPCAADHVGALLVQARRHGVTLHAVLSAAALLAAAEALDASQGNLRLATPISLRERCEPVPSGMGVFIAGIETDIRLAPDDDVWSVASRCMRDLVRKRPAAHREVGLLAFAGDLEALAKKYEAEAHGRTATVEVSNVGRVRGMPHGSALWLTQGAHYHAPLFVLTIATSDSDGALRCCLSCPEPLIDQPRAASFMRAFERRLLSALG
jgi:hypothetical protein